MGRTIPEELDNYDWEQAFMYADGQPVIGSAAEPGPFDRADVEEVIAVVEGENDGESWLGAFRLSDGRFAFLAAWCDYTGWDCQAGGGAFVASSLHELLRFGVTPDERSRLGLSLPVSA
jgi:hypothetical protein